MQRPDTPPPGGDGQGGDPGTLTWPCLVFRREFPLASEAGLFVKRSVVVNGICLQME